MNDEELKDLWRKQKLEAAPLVDARAQIEALRNKMACLHRGLKVSGFWELALYAVIIVVFTIYFFTIPHFVTRIGALILVGGLLFATWKSIQSRRSTPQPIADAPVVEWLKYDLATVHEQAELNRTMMWWYLLPFLIGMNFFFWGLPVSLAAKIGPSVLTVLIVASTYWLNQRARRKQWLPLQEELEALLLTESPAGRAEPRPSASAPRVNRFIGAGIVLVVLFAGLMVVWNSARHELPRAPGFADVSAFSDADISRLDAWLQEEVARAQYPSLSVAIVRDGKVIYQNAFGFEDMKARRKATPETSYNVASVTKAFTATLAVLLHERGVIDLDQPVAKYLPQDVSISTKPILGATITLRQLASHTSGLPRGTPGPVQSVEGRYQLEPKRLYDQLAKVTLEFDPGTAELYSNLGFGLLGHALERAANKPFDQLLQELVCDPLHLERTAIQVNDKLQLATGYSSSTPRREEKHSYRERFASSGGLVASAPDLAQFLAAQMKPGLLTSEMLTQLHTPSKLSNGSLAHTALGWSVGSNSTIGRLLEKNGGRNNCSAWIGFTPEQGVGVVVLANCGEPSVDPIGRWLLERSVPGDPKPVPR